MSRFATIALVGLVGLSDAASQARADLLPPLEPDAVLDRLQIKGEVFALDPSGNRLIGASNHSSLWTPAGRRRGRAIDIHWGHTSDTGGAILLHQTWTVRTDGTIAVTLEQFAEEQDQGQGHRHEFVNSLHKQTFEIKDFAPVIWESVTPPAGRRVIVRLTPNLADAAPKTLSKLPMAAEEAALFDNQGHAWADHLSFSGAYVGIVTVEGTLALSFYPFAGAEPIGTAEGSRVSILLADQRKVTLMSQTPFLPGQTRATVYARYAAQKMDAVGQAHLIDDDDESQFLEALDHRP